MPIYILRMRGSDYYKIGFTYPHTTVRGRIRELQSGCPEALELVTTMPGDRKFERALHRKLKAYKTSGGNEWFRFSEGFMEEAFWKEAVSRPI